MNSETRRSSLLVSPTYFLSVKIYFHIPIPKERDFSDATALRNLPAKQETARPAAITIIINSKNEEPVGPNPFIGVIYHWIGGFASATNFIPFRAIKRWSWEIYWVIQ